MSDLTSLAASLGALLKDRGQTVAVAESAAGGLISAALVAVPGASAYYLGGSVFYTQASRRGILHMPVEAYAGMRASTEPYAVKPICGCLPGPHWSCSKRASRRNRP